MIFNMGDKVKVIATEARLKDLCITKHPEFIGMIGTVEGKRGLYSYDILLPGQSMTWGFWVDDLELVNDSAEKLYGHPRFYEILKQMEELHSRKNHDYAGGSDPLKNLRACERLELRPFLGVMVRLQDKWSRLEEFIKSGQLLVKSESVIDTLIDNAVYSVLAIILYEEELDYAAAIDHETGCDMLEEQQKQKAESKPGYGGQPALNSAPAPDAGR